MSQNKVKSIHTYISNQLAMVDYDSADSNSRYLASYKEFDENGNITKEIGYRPDTLIENNYSNIYDANNHLIEHSIYDENNELLECHKYDLDENGRVIGESCFYAEMDDNDYTTYLYDNDGHLIEKRNVDSDNELYHLKQFTYENQKLIKEQLFNDEQKLETETIYEYDENGLRISEINIDNLEGDKQTFKYDYNELGQRIETLHYNKKDQLVAKSFFEYDEQGVNIQLIEEDVNGVYTTVFDYNELGKIQTQEKYNHEEELIVRWIYEYEDDRLVKTKTLVRDENAEESDEDEMVVKIISEFIHELY
jgi:hypothetical protein